ncbi:MAG: serine/threonine protein kinase [Myxococcales bacterium]|nr:serine/threonine protein kinase [Myxococcales bacterium]
MTESMIGRTIGKCRIERLLGSGAMGDVYQGTHEALELSVAVKILALGRHHGAGEDATDTARFLREARLAASLRHPNIVRVADVGEDQGVHYIVMELLQGTTLGALMDARGALPLEWVKRIGRQVAAALAHAHGKGVFHRDIKPDNVMIAPDGSAVLTDFGIASAGTAAGGERLTQQGMAVGTPLYISPEQVKGGPVDGRCDIYGLGVMLYEMLTGTYPFHGDDPLQQLVARLHADPVPITDLAPDLPPNIVALITRMLARDPRDRVQTAEVVERALGGSAHDETVTPPLPLADTSQVATIQARTSELTVLADSAGLPFTTPPGAHLLEIRLANVGATLRLAEEESAEGAALFLVHRVGQADLIAFVAGRPTLAVQVERGVARPVTTKSVVSGAMARGEGALVVRKVEPSVVAALRAWANGDRVLGPLPSEIVRPAGLFAWLRRTTATGVLAVRDRSQTSLISLSQGNPTAMLVATAHRRDSSKGDSDAATTAWLEARSSDATLEFRATDAALEESPSVAAPVGDTLVHAALEAAVAGATMFAKESQRDFGLGSAAVFSKMLREATSALREVVPVAALAGQKGVVDLDLVWSAIGAGSRVGRALAARLVAEALLRGALRAAGTVLTPKRLGKVNKAVLAHLLEARRPLDAIEATESLMTLLSGAAA